MKLPNSQHAVIDINKLQGYCLNHLHPRGKDKARVFSAALGLTIDHADMLQKALFDAAKTYEATLTTKDIYGQRYVIDFIMSGPTGVAMIRSAWIIRINEDFPRLTTCYVLGRKR